MAAASAVVRREDRNLHSANGGPIGITNTWAKLFLNRIGFVKRKASSSAKISIENFKAVKELFLIDIEAIMEIEEIQPELVFNWDQTGISIIPGSSWTMETKVSKSELVMVGTSLSFTRHFFKSISIPDPLVYVITSNHCFHLKRQLAVRPLLNAIYLWVWN